MALEIVAILVALRRGAPTLETIAGMAVWLSIPFAGAFVLLAVARRWGFIALWAILGAFWILLALASGAWAWASQFPRLFLPWSVFALPLWIIGQAGIPSPSPTRLRVGPVRMSTSMALLLCWAALLVSVEAFALRQAWIFRASTLTNLFGWIWGLAPLVLSAYAIRHVWRGTARPVVA
jgi:hypothetical protein